MLLLDLSGLGYLLIGPQPDQRPTALQWALAVPAFVSALALHRRPAANLLVQVSLLAVAFVVLDDTTINQVGASWALLELAMWSRRLAPVWWASGLIATLYLAFAVG